MDFHFCNNAVTVLIWFFLRAKWRNEPLEDNLEKVSLDRSTFEEKLVIEKHVMQWQDNSTGWHYNLIEEPM